MKGLEVLITGQWERQELGLSLLFLAVVPASLWDAIISVPSHNIGSRKDSPRPLSPLCSSCPWTPKWEPELG